ncbi:DUF445 domain-containing protein [Pseudalkalibacillus hwajinpoensis]|uniref:DUF445 domain-containing protein n=1 Tax=Guptibacillus hwajinpoensis TaxID=208199 RepID=UPI001CD20D8E|nr:DUF445 family protein [Pseudalkalibacillus hwajinpoensis]MCA0993018.1 DUF445 family protein [Pseudalkalibacillus hwajinpoensis]
MSSIIITILFMIAIGAVIGGFTNSLAIKMLFRPYEARHIGKWKVPFTPGLIPKRRDELAVQLGKMVVEHLLTAEGIQQKMNDPVFKRTMIEYAQKEVLKLLETDEKIEDLLKRGLHLENPEQEIRLKASTYLTKKIETKLVSLKSKELTEVLPEKTQERIDGAIEPIADLILTKISDYIASSEGKNKLSVMIDRYLADRGTLGSMINMFFTNTRLVDKVQPELLRLLKQKDIQNVIITMLEKEWQSLKETKLETFEEKFDSEELVQGITNLIVDELPIQHVMNLSLSEAVEPYKQRIVEDFVPRIVDAAGQYLSQNLQPLMEQLHLADVVKSQVETFSVGRLEEMVLSISRREFKMITYLGAVLGGLIGLIQGIIITLMG